jgi:anti-anti-sigma factor
MEITVRTLDHATVLVPDGAVDTRSALEFERKAVAAVNDASKHVVVDFTKVDLITSAGLRVLVMVGKKLAKSRRQLVLCSLNDLIKTVLEVSGLTQAFTLAASEAKALELLAGVGAGPVQAGPSKLASHVLRLLSLGTTAAEDTSTRPSLSPATSDALASRVVDLLDRRR